MWPSLARLEGGSCTKIWPVPEAVVTVLCAPGQAWPRWRELAAQTIWPVPEAVVTVLFTPGQAWPRWREVAAQTIWPVPEAAVTVFCAPGQAWPRWREVAAQKIWPVPEAVVTVLCTSDDGCGWHPKHVQWTCRIINRLLCVASRWTIINIDQRCTEL